MSNLRLSFVIDAVDKATATVTRVGQKLDRLADPIRRLRTNLRAVAADDKLQQAASENLRRRMDSVSNAGALMARAWGAATIAIGGGLLGVKATIDEVDRTLDLSKKLGIPIEQFQRLGFAAKLNGSSMDEMAQALQFLSQNQVEALLGSKEQALWFARVGISVQQLRRMNPVEILERMADKFQQVGDVGLNAQKKIALMRALMGRGGAELKQMLDMGSAGLRKFYDEADRLGAVISGPAAEAMGDFNDEWDRMTSAAQGAARATASALLPLLTSLTKRYTEWLGVNREAKAAKIAQFADDLVERLPSVLTALQQIGSALATLIGWADRAAQMFGGWGNVLYLFAGVVAIKAVLGLKALAAELLVVNAAMLANPVTWVVAGVVALGVAAGVLISKWEPARKFFADLLQDITLLFGKFMLFARQGLPQWMLPGPAMESPLKLSPTEAARVGLGGSPIRPELGGTLKIEIDSNGRPAVRELRKASGGILDYEVDLGLNLARP